MPVCRKKSGYFPNLENTQIFFNKPFPQLLLLRTLTFYSIFLINFYNNLLIVGIWQKTKCSHFRAILSVKSIVMSKEHCRSIILILKCFNENAPKWDYYSFFLTLCTKFKRTDEGSLPFFLRQIVQSLHNSNLKK